jgi:hypothetical protein
VCALAQHHAAQRLGAIRRHKLILAVHLVKNRRKVILQGLNFMEVVVHRFANAPRALGNLV